MAWGSGHRCPECDIKQWRYMYGTTTCPSCGVVINLKGEVIMSKALIIFIEEIKVMAGNHGFKVSEVVLTGENETTGANIKLRAVNPQPKTLGVNVSEVVETVDKFG